MAWQRWTPCSGGRSLGRRRHRQPRASIDPSGHAGRIDAVGRSEHSAWAGPATQAARQRASRSRPRAGRRNRRGEVMTCRRSRTPSCSTWSLPVWVSAESSFERGFGSSRPRRIWWFASSRTTTSVRLLTDQAALAKAAPPPVLSGEITKNADGHWRFALIGGIISERPEKEPSPSPWMTGLTHSGTARPAIWSYLGLPQSPNRQHRCDKSQGGSEYFPGHRSDGRVGSAVSRGYCQTGSLRRASGGSKCSPCWPSSSGRHSTFFPPPLLHSRSASSGGHSSRMSADHKAMLSANRVLAERCMELGVKVYPPVRPAAFTRGVAEALRRPDVGALRSGQTGVRSEQGSHARRRRVRLTD